MTEESGGTRKRNRPLCLLGAIGLPGFAWPARLDGMKSGFVIASLVLGLGSLRGEIVVEKWAPLFRGVEFAEGRADEAEPRLQQVHAVRIDLRAPGIEFLSTPANGDAPQETTSETPREFLERHSLQVAINANFFSPCCLPGDKDLTGLAISRGELVSRPVASGVGSKVLVLTRENEAAILETDGDFAPQRYWTAVAGSDLVLVDGKKPEFVSSPFRTGLHPRTAVGLSVDKRYLILLVIDGRQPGFSDGATLEGVADWLLRFGAHSGLNLDGGGSTALVWNDQGRSVEVNRPSGLALASGGSGGIPSMERVQRSNGNNLGVFARPLSGVYLPRTPQPSATSR